MSSRNSAEKTRAWIVALILIAVAIFAASGLLTWAVSIIHDWWQFVPLMPYSVALQITAVMAISGFMGTVIKAIMNASGATKTTAKSREFRRITGPSARGGELIG